MVTSCNKHTFVGVDVEFMDNDSVMLSMDDLAKVDLFDDDNIKKVDNDKAYKFHHTSAKQ